MTTKSCPACNAPIDPARAPVARVRGGRVVTFCSQACADAPETGDRAEPAAAAGDTGRVSGDAGFGGGEATASEPRYGEPGRRTRGGGKGRVIMLSAAILVGGMIITIINAVSPSTPVDVRAQQAAPPAPGAVEPTSPKPASAVEAVDPYAAAQSTLRALMESPSARVQRIAAMALARLGALEAPVAVEMLARMIDEESSDLGRIEVAYGLARARDSRGRKVLLAALSHDRRDVRLDAAGALVQLGDDAGNRVLERLLSLSTHRLGVAALLARRGNEDGLAALREVLADRDESNELIMRAAVALGRAGDASVRDRLVEILDDGRYHVGAADALATLEDPAAVPALIRQLELSSMRVRAALGLRRLAQEVPLDNLVAALEQGSEAARVSAAEAILILAGPSHLAELD